MSLRKELEWPDPYDFKEIKTLVLGSFNPYNPNPNKNVDYYYGRERNGFWKAIARILKKSSENYYLDSLGRKRDIMDEFKFAFFDVIDSINVSCTNEDILSEYIEKKIYANFEDSVLFTSSTNYKNIKMNIERNYNRRIKEFLKSSRRVNVIHTMGNYRISSNLKTKPIKDGFQKFILDIKHLCNQQGGEFISGSHSPSQRAINTGKTPIKEFEIWISDNILKI